MVILMIATVHGHHNDYIAIKNMMIIIIFIINYLNHSWVPHPIPSVPFLQVPQVFPGDDDDNGDDGDDVEVDGHHLCSKSTA